jgi:hypothetical protein
MIATPFYYQKTPEKKGRRGLFRYVTQRSLAVVMFIAFALLASVGNKSSKSITPTLSGQQSSDEARYLSLNPRHLFDNIARSVKDAFNDPALIEYAKEQGIDGCDSLTTPCSNTSRKTETFHASQ